MVKCVVDDHDFAMYFSRAGIPHHAAAADSGDIDTSGNTPYLKHVGLYAYRPAALMDFISAPPSPLERAESLEQLRALQLGLRIKVLEVDDAHNGVDTPAQLEHAKEVWLDRGAARGTPRR